MSALALGLTVAAAILVFVLIEIVRRRDVRTTPWGVPVERERDDHGLAQALRSMTKGENPTVTDRTWRDLSLGAVFARVDRCLTTAGQLMLYRRLRFPAEDAGSLGAFERAVGAFEDDVALRSRFARAVRARTSGLAMVPLLYGAAPSLPRGARFYPFATFATIATGAAALVWPVLALACLGSLVLNIALRIALHRTMSLQSGATVALAELVASGRELAMLAHDGLEREIGVVRAAASAIDPYAMALRWNVLDPTRMSEVLAIVVAYANMVLLLDVHAFVRTIELVRRARGPLVRLFEQMGELDAARSVASYRAGLGVWSRPSFGAPSDPISITELRHPLLGDSVANDATIEPSSGWLVTGSNMSGKSTFLRAVATNAILAQALGCVTARSYRAPFVRVRTLIQVEDDLSTKQSHFLVEARAARDLLVEATVIPRLVVIDELFRGTNTTDRVAAGGAFLRALARTGTFVLAATHDAELIDLLDEDYAPHYFAEAVADDALSFDYRLRRGAFAPRNAFAVLALVGFPPEVIDDARSLSLRE